MKLRARAEANCSCDLPSLQTQETRPRWALVELVVAGEAIMAPSLVGSGGSSAVEPTRLVVVIVSPAILGVVVEVQQRLSTPSARLCRTAPA